MKSALTEPHLAWFTTRNTHTVPTCAHSHLASVEPVDRPREGRTAIASPVSADFAILLLLQRFAAPGSAGIPQLLDHVAELTSLATRAAHTEGAHEDAAAALGIGQRDRSRQTAPALQPDRGAGFSDDAARLSSALLVIAERGALFEVPGAHPEQFVPSVVRQLLRGAAAIKRTGHATAQQRLEPPQQPLDKQYWQEQQAHKRQGGLVNHEQRPAHNELDQGQPEFAFSNAADNASAAVSFAVEVMSRFSRRGHAHLVASALLDVLVYAVAEPKAAGDPGQVMHSKLYWQCADVHSSRWQRRC